MIRWNECNIEKELYSEYEKEKVYQKMYDVDIDVAKEVCKGKE